MRIVLCVVFCGLVGCAGTSPAPIEDRGGAQQQPAYSIHTVKRGDTLYSIAFRFGMDFRKVAAANGIVPPYTIYPGQQIKLSETPQLGVRVPASTYPVASPSAATVRTAPAPAPVPRAAPMPRPVAPPAVVTSPPPAPVSPAPARQQVPAAPRPKSDAETFTGETVAVWRWPTSGPVMRGYSESVHKGIDIGGARGDPVTAVAPGKVVYAGTGIAGFGELLIIKHNDVYLSAYGHNDELLVAEGDTVTAGQTIAQKGSSGTDVVKLHFEIRQEGKPIDPLRLLPGR